MPIYFLQPTDGGPVKIGFSNDVDRRKAELEAKYEMPLILLRTMRGERKKEHELHMRFAHLRLGTSEQFQPAPELMEFIGRPLFTSANPDAVKEIESKLVSIRLDLTPQERDKLRVVAAMSPHKNMAVYVRELIREDISKYDYIVDEIPDDPL
jgi:Meiotically up-regulated gene 113